MTSNETFHPIANTERWLIIFENAKKRGSQSIQICNSIEKSEKTKLVLSTARQRKRNDRSKRTIKRYYKRCYEFFSKSKNLIRIILGKA